MSNLKKEEEEKSDMARMLEMLQGLAVRLPCIAEIKGRARF